MNIVSRIPNRIKLSINSVPLESKPGPSDPAWFRMTSTWEPRVVSVVGLADYVRRGHSFTALLATSYRHTKNLVSVQHVCLDFDTEDERSSLDALSSDPWLRENAAFAYTTMSHRPEAPRARVVLFLSGPVTDPDAYSLGMEALMVKYPDADPACKDAVRWHLGSYGCDMMRFSGGGVLDADWFLDSGVMLAAQRERERQVLASARAAVNAARYNGKSDPDTYHGQLADMLVSDVASARQGERNNTFYTKGVKAVARFGLADAVPVLERMMDAAISAGLTEREAAATYNSILRSNPNA